eukprot:CAMPEP_0174830506 /NCGR_PEP_ID=MMETSP1114-20130205/2559_1 /TAXON_ID=312471 /ORGANISM="Neobodo designis, Strain CCAP 1951/1" /LENGTH=414 /DNA_ID=CAMNT_0016064305 /DNA_START=27 /DNA_END=1268 /DNA_ORIENTATION=-
MQGEYCFGTVCQASFSAVADIAMRFGNVDVWAKNVVSSCVAESSVPMSENGGARRCVLSTGQIWRETLTGQFHGPCQAFVTSRLLEAVLNEHRPLTLRETCAKFSTELAGEPSPQRELFRCDAAPIVDAISTLSVFPISDNPSRCFVRFHVTFDCSSAEDVGIARCFFERHWGRPMVEALCAFALGAEFPMIETNAVWAKPPLQDEAEDLLATVTVSGSQDHARVIASIVDGYYSTFSDCNRQEQQNKALREELISSNAMVRSLAAEVAALEERCQRAEHDALLAHHAGTAQCEIPRTDCGTQTIIAEDVVQSTRPLTPEAKPAVPANSVPKPYLVRDLSDDELDAAFAELAESGVVPFGKVVTLFAKQRSRATFDFEGQSSATALQAARTDAKRWFDKALRGKLQSLDRDQFG